MKRTATAILACYATCLIGNASAALVVNLSAGSGTDTTVDGATVNTWGRDNGGRYDIAFKTNIQLSEDKKLELMNTFTPVSPLYDDSSSAYHYVHPPGL